MSQFGDDLCPTCGENMPCAAHLPSPWPEENRPGTTRAPVPIIGVQERDLRFQTTPESGAVIPIDQRQGFIPVLFWVSFSQDVTTGLPGFVEARIELTVATGALGAGQAQASYMLSHRPVRFFTLVSQGYHGIALPMRGGQAQPYNLSIMCFDAPTIWKQLRVQWGYRPIDKTTTGLTGAG